MVETYSREEILKNRKKWVKALRSGDYVQSRNAFVSLESIPSRKKHCCLAVLCDVLDPDGWNSNGEHRLSDNVVGSITVATGRMVGLSYTDRGEFIRMNDQHKNSFDEIAHVVENLPLP